MSGTTKIKDKIMEDLTIPIAMVATLVLAGLTAAASIAVALRNAVLSSAGLLELYFLFLMLKGL